MCCRAEVLQFCSANGVFVASGSHDDIRGNSIFGNTSLGIDLASGANQNQAAPVITTVNTLPGIFVVTGTLTSTPSKLFTIDVFANDTGGPSGRIFLGSAIAVTNNAGLATFVFVGLRPAGGAHIITATATDQQHNTSEFFTPVI